MIKKIKALLVENRDFHKSQTRRQVTFCMDNSHKKMNSMTALLIVKKKRT